MEELEEHKIYIYNVTSGENLTESYSEGFITYQYLIELIEESNPQIELGDITIMYMNKEK